MLSPWLVDLSLRDLLMLQIMAETGLRRRAVSWLLVESVFDRVNGAPLPMGRALEKGMIVRPFQLSQHTSDLLIRYIRDEHPGDHVRWLFPSPKKGNTQPITPSVVNNILLRACAQDILYVHYVLFAKRPTSMANIPTVMRFANLWFAP